MGAGASLQEDVPTGWHALAAMAEAADKPDLVAKIVRENQIDAATALKLDDDDLRELVDRKLDFKKLQGARDELRELGARGTHLVSSDSEDDASDGDEIPPHVPRISNDEIDRAEALDARGGVFAATWRPRKGRPVAVALKAVDAVDLAEVFALRSFADPNVLLLYGVVVAGSSDVATVAERPDAPLDVVLCGNPLPRVDSLRVARDMASALTFLHSREVAHMRLAPSNVLCHRAPHLRCKVADFGASVSAAIERLERNPCARAYAAPELLEAVRAPLAAARRDLYACDAWAYGCVIVEVLSGTAPWDGVDGEGILAQVVDAARAPDLPEQASAEELLTLARECFARLATPRPAMGDVVARVEVLLEADYARGASAEQRLAKVEAAIEAEEASDRAAYSEAWSCCTTASGDAAIDRLLKLSESLAATYAATPRHAALARDAPVAELLDLAAEVGESVHATLKRVVTAAGGEYEEGPLKAKARIQQKRRSADYGGDLARVVDVVRGQGIFHDNQADAFEAALQHLVEGGADAASGEEAKGEEDRLVLVRVKDRLNTPVEKRTGFVGELQLTFRGLLDVKASAHRIYNISRAREDEDEAVAAVSEPSLRNSDVLSLVARGSSRTVRSLFGGSIALRKALGRALPRGLVVSAIYDGTGGAAKVRLDLADVAALQRLRDAVLDGSIDGKLCAEVQAVAVDRGAFAQRLATSLLRFEELTAHQRRALVQTRGARAVLLTAPAGGGKTFVAIARAVEALDEGGYVVFAARAEALVLFFCKWLTLRMESSRGRVAVSKLFDEKLRVVVGAEFSDLWTVGVEGGRLELAVDARGDRWARRARRHRRATKLVVVDEAHHVAGDTRLRQRLATLESRSTKYLCLADASQAESDGDIAASIAGLVPGAAGSAIPVALTEVVRSTKRIVVGSAAFQLAAGRRAETTAATASVGPPLEAVVFDASRTGATDEYARRVAGAIERLEEKYRGLSLHDRVAIVCPDEGFVDALRGPLASALPDAYHLVDAATASAALPPLHEEEDEDVEIRQDLVLDAIENFDGLERLFVICVGLDARIDGGLAGETRSRLYRAMTRAQLGVIVVNARLPGGWLEFLGRVSFRGDEAFDEARERERGTACAADDFCSVAAEADVPSGQIAEAKADEAAKGEARNANAGVEAAEASEERKDGASEGSSERGPADGAQMSVRRGFGTLDATIMATPVVEQSIWTTTWEAEKAETVTSGFMPFSASMTDRRVLELMAAAQKDKTPLYIACEKGETAAVRLLLDRAADVDRATEAGWTPLLIACQNGHVDAARLLLEKGAEVDRAEKDGWTPLYVACENGHVDAARLLLDNGAAVDRAKNNGCTPLYIACKEGHVDAVQLLLDNGADINRATESGATPLHVACQNGHVDAARLLLEKGAEVDRAEKDGWTPLFVVCWKGHVHAARLLLDNGADVNRAMKDGWTPLYIACQNGHVDAARLLLEKGAEVDRAEKDGWTPLLIACQNGHVDAARLLLDKGAEVDRATKKGSTPLYIACDNGHVDAARLLLDNGAEVDKANEWGGTPLYIACDNGHVDAARLLLDKGAEVDRATKKGSTPLYIACDNGHVDAARLLLDNGAEVDKANEWGGTPLYIACDNGHVDAARLLLDNGAELDRAQNQGATPLYIACQNGHVDAARLLLEKSADVDRALNDGRTPLSIAKRQGHSAVVALLEAHRK